MAHRALRAIMKKGGKGKSSREKESQGANIVNTPDELDIEDDCIVCASATVSGNDDLPTVCDGQLEMDARLQDQVGDRLLYGNRAGISMKQQLIDIQDELKKVSSRLTRVESDYDYFKKSYITYTSIRCRFLAVFKRNYFPSKMESSDYADIDRGNLEVHAGDLITDAKLFIGRNDIWLFKELYGVDPSAALKLEGTDVCRVINSYATIRAENPSRLNNPLKEAFGEIVGLLKEAEYKCAAFSSPTSPMGRAYSNFWDAKNSLPPRSTHVS